MIHQTRVRELNDLPPHPGKYVLYWMQASQRTRFNHALEYAIERANALGVPALVGFGLMDDYPEANARHYAFMLEGLRDVEAALRERGIRFVVRHGAPQHVACDLGKDAAMIVCDRGYTRHQKAWRDHVADHAGRRVVEVETDAIVPVEAASEKADFAARTIRPKLHKRWPEYLVPLKHRAVEHLSLRLRVNGDIDVSDPVKAMSKLTLDRSVAPSPCFTGGERAAHARLDAFLAGRLSGYGAGRNEPSEDRTTMLAAYLHFGQISPLELALRVKDSAAPREDRDALLEELGVRRELAINFVHYCPKYDAYDCLPDWAKKTLAEHRRDERPHVYTREQLEAAETYDPYWNAAQQEMNKTGYMHNYMRMYWGKKILEWSASPEEAFETTLYLNNRLFLCGRDPNSYASVAWIFGLHDRPWGPARPIFGTVRYMNAAGLNRKFDMDAYVNKVAAM